MANLDITPDSSQLWQMLSPESPACPMVPMKSRRLTVGYGSATLRPTREGFPVPKPEPAPAPQLRLQGRWLDRAGFRIGANVRVLVTPGRVDFNILRQLFQQFPSAKVCVLREGGQIDPTGLPIHLRPSLHSRGQPCASRRSRRR
jgi:hypothetical protein